jgi:hypothetical protein
VLRIIDAREITGTLSSAGFARMLSGIVFADSLGSMRAALMSS